MNLYKITVTDKNRPEYAECPDEFTYLVGAESLPDAIKVAWDKYGLGGNFDPQTDSIVVRDVGELLI